MFTIPHLYISTYAVLRIYSDALPEGVRVQEVGLVPVEGQHHQVQVDAGAVDEVALMIVHVRATVNANAIVTVKGTEETEIEGIVTAIVAAHVKTRRHHFHVRSEDLSTRLTQKPSNSPNSAKEKIESMSATCPTTSNMAI
jgi:hypothetical protein